MCDCLYPAKCRNGQRPGAVAGLTLKEFEEGEAACTGGPLVLLVADHKTKKPVKLVISDQLLQQLRDWVLTVRPLHVSGGCPYIFCTESGEKMNHLSRTLSTLAEEFDATLPTATSVRKAIATRGGELEAGDKEALAHTMSHSISTADRSYGESKGVQGYELIGSILDTQHRDKFPGRKRGDIYSKIRNLTSYCQPPDILTSYISLQRNFLYMYVPCLHLTFTVGSPTYTSSSHRIIMV